ncbi:molybdopterin synthase [Salinirubrum litoreum]|uniref:Molybdopterin synthase n=1 Tax=Salinirubrum litoreum TaxID=1126234 RepID=A0ABD5RE53_9EURY|nr:molybdopterin synthase [Salinirubrum litoreum]
MHTLGIVGPGASDLAERLAARLDGRVVTVESFPSADAPLGAPDTDAAYGLADDGSWIGAGGDCDLDTLLDDLAPDTDYLFAAGFPDADLPTVRITGDSEETSATSDGPAETEVTGSLVAEVSDPADADLAGLVETLHATEPHVTLGSLVAEAKRHPDAERSGAIATFTGRVRAKDAEDDDRTTALEFETYEGVADQRMATISEELESRDGVHAVLMHHRTGYVADGEDIVFVVVLAGHRREAFRTVEDGIDRLKDEVPIFKREITVDGDFWVHDRE